MLQRLMAVVVVVCATGLASVSEAGNSQTSNRLGLHRRSPRSPIPASVRPVIWSARGVSSDSAHSTNSRIPRRRT